MNSSTTTLRRPRKIYECKSCGTCLKKGHRCSTKAKQKRQKDALEDGDASAMGNSSKPRGTGHEPMKPLERAIRKARAFASEEYPTRIPSPNAIPSEERMLPRTTRGCERRIREETSADGLSGEMESMEQQEARLALLRRNMNPDSIFTSLILSHLPLGLRAKRMHQLIAPSVGHPSACSSS